MVTLVAHDRSDRMAARYSKRFPDLLDQLILTENLPTRIVAP
jgi:hypothetical protein